MHDIRIHLYTFCHNEEFIIPYFLRHYLPLVSKIIVFDNQSTDRSVDILRSYPNIFVKEWDTNNEYREDLKQAVANNIWKKSRGHADLAMVLDIDEFLYHPTFLQAVTSFLDSNYSVLRPVGFDMVTEQRPKTKNQIYDEVNEGTRNQQFDKMVLFDPNKIEEINYSPGNHLALPEGQVKILKMDHEFKLLHYRYLGAEYLINKHRLRGSRVGEVSRKNNWGYHYLFDEAKQREIFQKVYQNRQQII